MHSIRVHKEGDWMKAAGRIVFEPHAHNTYTHMSPYTCVVFTSIHINTYVHLFICVNIHVFIHTWI